MTTEMRPGSRFTARIRPAYNVEGEASAFATATPGLAVWQWPGLEGPNWCVGHIRSGVSLGFVCADPEQAMAFAAACGEIGDYWPRSFDEMMRLSIDERQWNRIIQLATDMGLRETPGSPPSASTDINGAW